VSQWIKKIITITVSILFFISAFPAFRVSASSRQGKKNERLLPINIPPQNRYLIKKTADQSFMPPSYNCDISNPMYQTPVKDQHSTDLCWAFAPMAAIESSTLKHAGKITDFSEAHAACALSKEGGNNLGLDQALSGYGWSNSIVSYLMRGSLQGVINESEYPFDTDTLPEIPLSEAKSKNASYTVPHAYMITADDFNFSRDAVKIKEAVMKYGAVTSYIAVSDEFFYGANNDTHAYFFDGDSNARGGKHFGHTVVIVGWDDNYSKANFPSQYKRPRHADKNPNGTYFISQPKNNGAWLIKNSWGNDWFGYDGYAWISYEDIYIGNCGFAFAPAEHFEPGKTIYEHDAFGYCGYISNWDYGMNVFSAESAGEILKEVKVFAPVGGEHIEIYCIPDYENADGIDFGKMVPAAEFDAADSYGTAYIGYYTIPLEEPIPVGTKFAVAVKYENGFIPVEKFINGYNSLITANAGESYVFNEAESGLTDISASQKQNICVKAVTITKRQHDFNKALQNNLRSAPN
jgi:C1A family cysteine protease